MAADRDLLFGLLALQNGMIRQTQLVAAFHAWTCNKSRSLADHLLDRGDLDADDRGAVEALVARHLKHHGGGLDQSLAAVPASRAVRVSLAALGEPEIEATLARVARAKNGAAIATDDDDPDRTATIAVGSATSDGQRFRILRPHARGGLGEVFVALDEELHREVALKEILDKHADDPVSRSRFVLEAEITGGLEHPGIVPVYGLGTHAGGRPYYAMRFIKGDSLKEVIARFHTDRTLMNDSGRRSIERRKLLRRFTDVCDAIDYAHSRGVIHRDLKPANIIVGKHGETLVVDWGLAKSIGRADPSVGEQTITPSHSGSSETQPGSALGTPAYMSPEQARGELHRLGPQSDVYSLGATLYCLLTGKPPFEGEDIGAILHAVQDGRSTRPSLLDPSLDKALEVICLKAMATVPQDRYPTPRALADDLERWMADEPVTAWREPRTRKLIRWLSRHRTGVTGSGAALLAGVVGLCAVLAVQSVANTRLLQSLRRETNAKDALATANADLKSSKAAVQARYELAVEAIKATHTGISEDFLLKEERFKEHRDRLLKSASYFYGKLSALLGKETDSASRRALAQSNFELAELTRKVGRQEAALAEHQAVLEAREALAGEPGADSEMKVDVGRSLTAVAYLLDGTGKSDEALATYRHAESLLAGAATSDPAARAALAACRTEMATLLFYAGKHAEALAAVRLARADKEVLAAAPGASNGARFELAVTINHIGWVLWNSGKPAEAVPELRAALANYQRLVDEEAGVTEFRRGLAGSHFYLGCVLPLTGKPAEGEAEFRTSLEILQKLVDENPAVTRLRRTLGLYHNYFGDLLLQVGKPAEAEAECRKARALLLKVVDESPSVPDFRGVLAICHRSLGLVLLQVGKPALAEAECRKAQVLGEKLADDNPSVVYHGFELVRDLYTLGDVIRSTGRAAEVRGYYERAIALLERLVQQDMTNTYNRYELAFSLWRRALILRELGDPAGAAADLRQAIESLDRLPWQWGQGFFETACCHAALAGLAGQPGSGISTEEGEIEAARAMQWLGRAVAMGYRNANELRIESALDPLRNRPDFERLMRDVVFPSELFAPSPPIP
jgi:serine/threonine-protein kinase